MLTSWCKKHTTVVERQFKAAIVCISRGQYCISVEPEPQGVRDLLWIRVADRPQQLHPFSQAALPIFYSTYGPSLFLLIAPFLLTNVQTKPRKSKPYFHEFQCCFSWDVLRTWKPIFLKVKLFLNFCVRQCANVYISMLNITRTGCQSLKF